MVTPKGINKTGGSNNKFTTVDSLGGDIMESAAAFLAKAGFDVTKTRDRQRLIRVGGILVLVVIICALAAVSVGGKSFDGGGGGGGGGLRTSGGEAVSGLDPAVELNRFLQEHPDTPGAHFAKMLKTNLYADPKNEEVRYSQGCEKLVDKALCFAGLVNYNSGKEDNKEQTVQMIVRDENGNEPSGIKFSTPYEMQRYGPSTNDGGLEQDERLNQVDISDYQVPTLGTVMACLPLMIASSAVAKHSKTSSKRTIIAELGPFFGLSSKCIATGLKYYAQDNPDDKKPLYYAYDTFDIKDNMGALRGRFGWVLQHFWPTLKGNKEKAPDKYPNAEERSFVFLWNRAVQTVYPLSHGVPGYIDPNAGQPTVFQRAQRLLGTSSYDAFQLSMITLDSVKDSSGWFNQMSAVLGPWPTLKAGTIFFLMDFELVDEQIKQVYGCLRPFLLPVYISWNKEHWAWIVKKDYDLRDPSVKACYAEINENVDKFLPAMVKQVWDDMMFVSQGLRGGSDNTNTAEEAPLKEGRDKLYQFISMRLRNAREQWARIAEL